MSRLDALLPLSPEAPPYVDNVRYCPHGMATSQNIFWKFVFNLSSQCDLSQNFFIKIFNLDLVF